MTEDASRRPWGTGLTVAAFVAAVTAGAIVVLSLGLTRVHPLLAVGLNLVAVGGLAPTVWGWRSRPVWRWFVLGSGVGVAAGWLALLAHGDSGDGGLTQGWFADRTPSRTSSQPGTSGRACARGPCAGAASRAPGSGAVRRGRRGVGSGSERSAWERVPPNAAPDGRSWGR